MPEELLALIGLECGPSATCKLARTCRALYTALDNESTWKLFLASFAYPGHAEIQPDVAKETCKERYCKACDRWVRRATLERVITVPGYACLWSPRAHRSVLNHTLAASSGQRACFTLAISASAACTRPTTRYGQSSLPSDLPLGGLYLLSRSRPVPDGTEARHSLSVPSAKASVSGA